MEAQAMMKRLESGEISNQEYLQFLKENEFISKETGKPNLEKFEADSKLGELQETMAQVISLIAFSYSFFFSEFQRVNSISFLD